MNVKITEFVSTKKHHNICQNDVELPDNEHMQYCIPR